MKPERWTQPFTRHGLPRLASQTLLIYLVITLLALFFVWSTATPETYRPLLLLYGIVMLVVTLALIAWLIARYTTQVQHSEARYRQLIEQATDGIFVCDQAGRFLDVNPAGCVLLNYPREELLQRKIGDMLEPQDRTELALHLEQIRLGQTVFATYRLLSHTGSSLTVEIKARQIAPNRIMSIVRDVTARHEMETSLRASEAQLRALITAMSDVILVLDAQGVYQQVAPTNPQALAAPPDQLLGKTLAQVLPPDTAAVCLSAIQRALQTRTTVNLEYDLIISQRPRWFSASISPISDDRVVWVARDVTSIKRREREWAAAAGLAATLRTTTSQAEVLPLIVEQIKSWLEIEAVALGVIDSFTEEVVAKATYGVWEQFLGNSLPLGQGAAATIMRTGGIFASNDLDDNPHIRRPELLQGMRALLVAPLTTDSGPVGMLAVGRTTPFAEEDSRLLSMLADIAAGALQRAIVHDQARRRTEQLATLNTIGRTLAELLDLPQIFAQLATAIQQIYPDMLALLISQYDAARQLMTCVYGWERGQLLDITPLPPLPLEPPGYGAQSESIHRRQPVIVKDLPARLKRAKSSVILGEEPLSAIYVPLLAKGEVSGVVQVQSKAYNRFTEEDAEFLALLAGTAAISIQNARLFEAERQQRRRAEALAQLATRLSAQVELDAVLQIACEETAHALNAPAACIYLYDETSDTLVFSSSYGLPAAFGQRTTPLPRAQFDAYLARFDRLVIIPDIQALPHLPDAALYAEYDIRTVTGIVLWREGRLIGALNVKSLGSLRQFSDDELALLAALAAQTVIAIENTRLVEAERRHRELAEALRDSAEALNNTLHTEDVLDQILTIVTRLVPNDATNIIALDDQVGRLIRWSGFTPPGQEEALRQLLLPLMEIPNLRHIVETGEPWVSSDTHNDPGWVIFPITRWIRSHIGVPLRAKGRTLGVLAVNSTTPNFYTPEHAQRLLAIAAQAAIALESAQLFDEAQQRVRELATLYDSSLAITSTLDKPAVLHSVTERLAQAVDATSTYIVWCDWEHDTGTIVAEYFSLQANELERRSDLGEVHQLSEYPRTLAALQAGRYSIMNLSQPDADPAIVEELIAYGGKSCLRMPLSTANHVHGYVVIWDSRTERDWTEAEVRVCQTLANQAAVTLENVQLYETTQRRAIEQAAVLEANRAISSTLDLPTMLQRLAEQIGRAIAVTSTYICEWNPRTSMATVLADYYGPQARPEERVSDLGHAYDLTRDMGLPAHWAISREAKIEHVDDPERPALRLEHMHRYGAQSILTVPLVAKDIVFGYAELWESRHRREFTPDEISLCRSMAQQAAIAFENARLFEAERKQLRQAQTLQAVGALLTAGMSLNEVFDYIFDLLAHVVHYDSVSIQLIDGDEILFAAGRGFSDMRRAHEIIRTSLLPTIQERWGQPHQRVMIIRDTQQDPQWYALPGSEPIRSWVGAALRVKGRLLGILNVDSFTPNSYDEATGETVAAFANQAAIAIENAQLHEAVRRHAEELEGRVADRTVELERERRRTTAILDAAGEGIMLTNLKGNIEYVNAAMERLTGHAASEILGQNPRLWQSGTTPVSFYQKMWQTITHGQIWRGELVNRRKDGTLYDTALTIAPVFDVDGQISGYVGVQRDISHQKELERLKDEFVSNVSHELRTPIANVKLYINLLTRGKPEKYEEYLQTLRREAARLEKLIEDLLDLSRLDLGRTPIVLEPTDVNQLAAQLIADRTALAASHQLLIDYRTESPLPLAQADPAMLGQVMSNILTNAINYTLADGVITVTTTARRRDEQTWITITIQDTGPGISPPDLPHIFERFYRGEAGRKSGMPGTGLGLAISAQIMNKLGGAITVESRRDEGAAFTIWLKPAD
ncbi:MAG TPA: GAF domain-containing protein [Anaerolineae bacterium]|nr:GAF domain-containing protein [Anaerolineae bacterium]